MDKETKEKIQSFKFFEDKQIIDKPSTIDVALPTLNDLEIDTIVYIEPRFYMVAWVKNSSAADKLVYIHEGNSIIGSFKPHSDRTDFVDRTLSPPTAINQNYLITYGVDQEANGKMSYVKFWEHESGLMQDIKSTSN